MPNLVLDEPQRKPTLVLDDPLEPMLIDDPVEAQKKAKQSLDTALEYDLPVDVIDSGLFDVVGRLSEDPFQDSYYSTTGPTGLETYHSLGGEISKITSNPVSRLIWTGLGPIGWPFQRVENLLASPLTPLSKYAARRASLAIKYVMSKANGIEPTQEMKEAVELQYFFKYLREHRKPAYEEAGKAIIPAVKAFNPWSKIPQRDLETFTDVYRGYWMGWMEDEPPPEWFAQTVGISASFVITPFVVGKVFQLAGKLGKANPVYKAIQQYRIPEYQQAKQLTRLETGARAYDAQQLGKSISQKDLTEIAKRISDKIGKPITPSAVQKRVIQIIKGGVTTQPALQGKATPIIDEFAKNAAILREHNLLSNYTYTTKLSRAKLAKIRKDIDTAKRQLDRLKTAPHYVRKGGEISAKFPGRAKQIQKLEETIEKGLNQIYMNDIYGGTNYFPRMYLSKEAELAGKKFPFWGKGRIRRGYAKQRLLIPAAKRKAMGELLTDYPVQKRLVQENIDIELAKLYRKINQTEGWTSRVDMPGFKQLPDDKAYGELAGKFVKSIIHQDMKDIHHIKNNFDVVYDTVLGSWKAAVTVWSPSLHFRNMFSNSILLDLSGVDHAQQAKLLAQAIKEIRNNSDDYMQAKRYLSRGSFSQAELLDDLLAGTKVAKPRATSIQKSLDYMAGTSRKMASKPADIYGKEEFLGKFIKFLSERNKGNTVIGSVQEANRWLFDYGDLASWEKNIMRRYVMPFYTFPRKAIPRVAEAIANNPHTVAKYPMMFWGMEKYSLYRLDLTERDYSQIKKIMPNYMKNGSYMLMPYRDKNGDLRFWDITYMLPWGTISDIQQRGISNTILSNPLIQAAGDDQRNKDSFTGKQIWLDTDTSEEKFVKRFLHFTQSAAPIPPWFPGGVYYDKIYESVTGKPSKKWDILLDKKPLLPETLLHTIGGVRLAPFDYEKQANFYWKDKQDQILEIERKLSDMVIQNFGGNVTEEELNQKREQYINQMVELLTEGE